jgi:hypothetical protein
LQDSVSVIVAALRTISYIIFAALQAHQMAMSLGKTKTLLTERRLKVQEGHSERELRCGVAEFVRIFKKNKTRKW